MDCFVGGFPCDRVTAVMATAQAAAMIAAVFVAAWQLRKLNDQIAIQGRREQKWATLQACLRWDTDPMLNEYSHHIWSKSAGGRDYTLLDDVEDKRKLLVVLNYLDGVAISVRQGMFLEDIVKTHFESLVPKLVRCTIRGESYDGYRGKMIGDESKYDNLIWLYNAMKRMPDPPPAIDDRPRQGRFVGPPRPR